MTDAVLIYDRWAYPIRHLQPGSTIAVDKELEPQTAETFLRHVTVFDEKSVRAPYDRSSTDIDRIMEMLLFYDLAGGELYTGLAHRYQNFVDLSHHVRLGQAVLLGRAGSRDQLAARRGAAGRASRRKCDLLPFPAARRAGRTPVANRTVANTIVANRTVVRSKLASSARFPQFTIRLFFQVHDT